MMGFYKGKKGETEVKTIFKTNDYLLTYKEPNESIIAFQSGINLYEYDDNKKSIIQVTNFINNDKKTKHKSFSFRKQQNNLFSYFSNNTSSSFKEQQIKNNLEKREISKIQISPDRTVIAVRITNKPIKTQTKVTSYVTKNGHTKTYDARPKVSKSEPNQKLAIYNLIEDTLCWIDFSKLKNIRKLPSLLIPK